ncbi:MAG: hypothetical protein LBT57_02215 [Puniceicoccales bacterium]|jgi:hypothetical protein|nr:hypothetical protein [Puniceicoccales bacterium]
MERLLVDGKENVKLKVEVIEGKGMEGRIEGVGSRPGAIAASGTGAVPALQQSGGNPSGAQAASQPPAMSGTLSLKDLARAPADRAVVQQTIHLITQDLARHVIRETGGTEISAVLVRRLVDEGTELHAELQRSADFKNQGQAKIWGMRVLCWIGSIVTLGVLPGLAKLIAPKSDLAHSLSRYLLGNGEVNEEKLQKFNQLFEKFQKLNALATRDIELKQQLSKAQEVPESLQGVQQQLKDSRSTLTQVTGFSSSDIPGDTAEQKDRYKSGRNACREVCASLERMSDGTPIPLDLTLRRLENRFQGLPDAADTDAIKEQVQALSAELDSLNEIMRSGEGRAFDARGKLVPLGEPDEVFQREPLGFEEAVKRQATNVHRSIRSLVSAFDGLEEQAAVQTARGEGADIKNARAENETTLATTSSEISNLILALGPRKKVPPLGKAFCRDINETLKGRRLDDKGDKYISSNSLHFKIDWNTAITEDTFKQDKPVFPEKCFFEIDLFRGPFTLTIGKESLESPRGSNAKQETRKFILEQITQLANANGLDRVAVLKNFLRTYIGQAGSGTFSVLPSQHLGNAQNRYDFGLMDHIHAALQIGDDGSCTISHSVNALNVRHTLMEPGQQDRQSSVPCNIHMEMAYTSSVDDFINGRPPQAVADRCGCSGHYLDRSATA